MATIPPLVLRKHRAPGAADQGAYDDTHAARHCNGAGDHACLHDHAGASTVLPAATTTVGWRVRVFGMRSA